MSIVNIVFKNKDFVICDKPAYALSTPDRFKTDRPCLGLELQKQLQMQIFPVHRLDFEVSGLIIYAQNAKAHKASQDWFSKKIIRKTYEALTYEQNFDHWPQNVPAARELIHFHPHKDFEWQMKIIRGKRRSFESDHGDWAETIAQMKEMLSVCQNNEVKRNLIYWQLQPVTGRAHQLRLELSRHGFPILNDILYGGVSFASSGLSAEWPHDGIALRSIKIQIESSEADRFDLPDVISVDPLRR